VKGKKGKKKKGRMEAVTESKGEKKREEGGASICIPTASSSAKANWAGRK